MPGGGLGGSRPIGMCADMGGNPGNAGGWAWGCYINYL